MSSFSIRLDSLLSYKTLKVVEIKNWKIGLLHYLIQISIICYVIGYAIIYEKGYQKTDTAVGFANAKLKGTAYYFSINSSTPNIWDIYDIVYPPKESDGFFITTSFWQTLGQTRGICADPQTGCNNTTPCPPIYSTLEDGVSMGVCNNSVNLCNLWAWCPIENEKKGKDSHLLYGLEDITVFLKINANFPTFNINRDNIGANLTDGVNFFTIGEMLSKADVQLNFNGKNGTGDTGAIILIAAHFKCNFDKKKGEDCKFDFTFKRIDDPNNTLSVGYNFRYTEYYWVNNGGVTEEYRDLYKVYGIRFLILTSGVGAKFNIVPLITNFGTGIALLGGATVISDFLLVYVLPKKKFYKNWKYEVEEEPASSSRLSLPSSLNGIGLQFADEFLETKPLLDKPVK